ncbi:MAG: type I restriction endonuclease subunit R [Microthrixaceae bacterium]|nr:type I restriction endonuclease subunit R [Acidimicrobiales bacterium]MCB9404136.1 type I restriction endonuclease subunit R [Microthrixaceae bacterium]
MAARLERDFEDEVVEVLTTESGWLLGAGQDLDLVTGINSADLVAFIGATQADEWEKWLKRFGDVDAAQVALRQRVAAEVDRRGTIDVLRNGVKGNGCKFSLCYFKPAHGLTPLLVERYQANRCTVTRQQRYTSSSTNTVDVVLWVNGLAVATVELKNPLTGQTVADAKAQYRSDRDPKDLFLSKRAVVHFAVDPHLAFMTTRLAGAGTRFLPFNQGHDGREGNPPSPSGRHATAYLCERVWQRDAFLDLVGRFIHTEVDEHGKLTGTVIFPRYHQWDCVLALEAHARANGAGHRYLAQHSAGSGKSNSIAWLAHRLSQLHDDHDKAVFDKVIVITDRKVLDEQLSGTVKQFEATAGVVRRVDGGGGAKNKDLADALTSPTARIILCTLQTFSYVDTTLGVGHRNYAVIVDEAHSSQTGEAAKDLKGVLGTASEEERLAIAEKVEAGEPVTGEDLIAEAVAARATQPNLSFFAFTATPKARTVELFGTLDQVSGNKGPFHVYSMRQAIEEGFILDVLRQYTTFDVFWKVRQSGHGDPEVAKAKASATIAKAISLHEHNVAQRAKIIVDHFREHIAHQLDGTAKAMVVTASRLHAVRYKQAIDRYLADHHISDTRAAVAFSGKVTDPDDPHGEAFTEPSMNGFPESETAKRFKGEDGFPVDGYQVLIVAEKYQTGFDAPRLLAMYVDKKLEGVNAVQTLARLNRSFPGKPLPFVLDFRNDAETITDAFRPWFDTTIVEPVDANILYRYQGTIEAAGVFDQTDVDHYWEVFAPISVNDRKGNGALYAALAGPRQRFTDELDEDEQDQFRSDLDSYCRAYSFLAQIVDWTDTDLEKLYVFARSLLADLPTRPGDAGIDLGSEIELTHLRIESKGTVDAAIGDNTPDPLDPFTGGGAGPAGDPETERLSAIVDRLNEKYGYQLTLTDALLFEQFKGDWMSDPALADAAKANTFENFMIVFAAKFMNVVLGRMDANADIFKAILDDTAFAEDLKLNYGRDLYHQLHD